MIKRILIDSLLELKSSINRYDGIFNDFYGICYNWKVNLDDEIAYTLINVLSLDWTHHTGDKYYPVPDDDTIGLWEGKNLEMRLSLIDHILKRLDEVDQDYVDDLIG